MSGILTDTDLDVLVIYGSDDDYGMEYRSN